MRAPGLQGRGDWVVVETLVSLVELALLSPPTPVASTFSLVLQSVGMKNQGR